MKKFKFIYLVSLLSVNFNAAYGTTELLIRAQDDETVGGLKIKLSIPQIIQDGPEGDNIEVISGSNLKAVKDGNGNFLEYKDVDKEGNIAPHIQLNHLDQRGKRFLASIFCGDRSLLLKVEYDDQKQPYVMLEGYTYDIPSFTDVSVYKRLPCNLKPLDKTGRPLGKRSIIHMPFFDNVSVFGTVWAVFNMYGKDIEGLYNDAAERRWSNRGKVRIFPHMTQEQFASLYPDEDYNENIKNAFYDYRENDEEGEHILCFFPVTLEEAEYTSRSFDVVSHEAGHNVLNILRPDLWHSTLSDVKAFHETFGDMTALFSVLQFSEMREIALNKTKGNRHLSSFLSVIGEKIVNRDATRCTNISMLPSCEEHDLSERLTRALYGVLADLFNVKRKDKPSGINDLLAQTTENLRIKFLQSTLEATFTTFIDFGKVLRSKGEPLFNQLVHINFLRQGIDLSGIPSSPQSCSLQDDEERSEQEFLGCTTNKMSRRRGHLYLGKYADA